MEAQARGKQNKKEIYLTKINFKMTNRAKTVLCKGIFMETV